MSSKEREKQSSHYGWVTLFFFFFLNSKVTKIKELYLIGVKATIIFTLKSDCFVQQNRQVSIAWQTDVNYRLITFGASKKKML